MFRREIFPRRSRGFAAGKSAALFGPAERRKPMSPKNAVNGAIVLPVIAPSSETTRPVKLYD